jgi:hypothetical protein
MPDVESAVYTLAMFEAYCLAPGLKFFLLSPTPLITSALALYPFLPIAGINYDPQLNETTVLRVEQDLGHSRSYASKPCGVVDGEYETGVWLRHVPCTPLIVFWAPELRCELWSKRTDFDQGQDIHNNRS